MSTTAEHLNETGKSHSDAEVRIAIQKDLGIWILDTGNDGEDDVLIDELYRGEEGIRDDILYHHDLDEWPEHWTLTLVEVTR